MYIHVVLVHITTRSTCYNVIHYTKRYILQDILDVKWNKLANNERHRNIVDYKCTVRNLHKIHIILFTRKIMSRVSNSWVCRNDRNVQRTLIILKNSNFYQLKSQNSCFIDHVRLLLLSLWYVSTVHLSNGQRIYVLYKHEKYVSDLMKFLISHMKKTWWYLVLIKFQNLTDDAFFLLHPVLYMRNEVIQLRGD